MPTLHHTSIRDSVIVDGRPLPLTDFLRYCATGRWPRPLRAPGPSALRQARDLFVRAGCDALAAAPEVAPWHQVGVRPASDPARRRDLYRRIGELAQRWLADARIENFFFLHKSPGLRLRFQPVDGSPPALARALRPEVTRWRDIGLVDTAVPGVYEPESALFGGPVSMPYVHTLFTVDSLTWLDCHADPGPQPAASIAAWVASLAGLRTLFDGLDITDREDLGVWEHVRSRTGRRLPPAVTTGPEYRAVADEVVGIWSAPEESAAELPARVRASLTGAREALLAGAVRWRDGYFRTRAASLGPRAAAAHYVVFHWNRAGLPPIQQALLAESLAGQEV